MSSLKQKSALVTGGSRGIGRGIALRLAERGAQVAVNYLRDETAATETLKAIEQRGGRGFVVQADVSDPDQVASMAARVREEFGQLDIFVNNALGNLLGFFAPRRWSRWPSSTRHSSLSRGPSSRRSES